MNVVESPTITREELPRLAERLEGQSAEAILRWAFAHYPASLTLACSFGGPSGMVLLDMVQSIAPGTPVFYLDTELLFPETYELASRAARRYDVVPVAVRPGLNPVQQASSHGEALWLRDPDACCALRKVAPQAAFLRGYAGWITGLRRDQASTRRATPVIGWDERFGLVKIAPLADWSEQQVWDYIRVHDVPYNPLHDRGYPSMGCVHCTRSVSHGEDARACRWSGTAKIECGLHMAPHRSAEA